MSDRYAQTKELLEKTPNFPCLYRHSVNGVYYAIKKVSGKKKTHCLETTDRKLAERRLKDWIQDIDRIDSSATKTSLEILLGKFSSANAGKAKKTQATNDSILKIFRETWKPGLDMHVCDVKPSHLAEWLGQHEGRLKNTSFNRYAGFLKQVFEIAVADRMIARSPFDDVKTKWKKPQKPIRKVPTAQTIFKIKDAKKALAASCKRLGFYNFTQRNMRQALIRRLWQSQVDPKLISKWQGHQDGGKLILDTYTEVFSASDAEYEKAQLGKII